MKREGPALSFRRDAVGDMAGAIFMSNTATREQCFNASIFGLPLEYQSFVSNVKKGMPLFLFDHTLRKLYGVFEAASDGGLNINNAAFRSMQRSYPAQVRINIVWKCRPLSEDEFSPAIEDNYYLPRKFYFDLSYEQVVRLYELFDDRRVQLPIQDYSKNEGLEINRSSKGKQGRKSLTPDVPHSIDQSRLLVPHISEVVRRYSTTTSMHTDLPLSVEAHPNISMPLGTEFFGAQIASTHRHHDQIEYQSQSEIFPAAVMTDAVSTQVSAPCSQTSMHYQLVAKQPYPLPQEYPQNILPSRCTTQDPTEGAKFIANQSYPPSSGYSHSGLLTSGYATQNPTYKGRSHLNSSLTPDDRLYPGLSHSNPQSNSDYQVHCDICLNQGRSTAHDNMYECERQRFSEGKALTPAKLSLQNIPTYPEALGHYGKTVSAIDRQRSSADYIQIPYCDKYFGNDQMKHAGSCSNASDSSDLENDIVDPRHAQHTRGAESKTKDLCSPPQRSVFSRLSLKKQLNCQEATGPTLNQLVSSLSQKTEQWSHKNGPIADILVPLIGEEATDPSHEQLSLPSQLELEEKEESIEPQAPFYNFKRRSEAGKVDANLGKEISGKAKRRKLVRPSLEENSASTNVGEELKGDCTEDRKQKHLEVIENHFDIDLNVPAPSVDSDPVEEDNKIAVCPTVVIKVPHERDVNKPNPDVMETTKEGHPSCESAQKISIDVNVAELDSMDESKLQTILDQASSLLQVLGKLKSRKPDSSEEARSSVCSEDRKVNVVVTSDGAHQT